MSKIMRNKYYSQATYMLPRKLQGKPLQWKTSALFRVFTKKVYILTQQK